MRERQSFNQEVRLVSKEIGQPFRWVLGVSYLSLEETNDRKDDGIYGDPADPYGPYESLSLAKSDYQSDNVSFFSNFDYEFFANFIFSLGLRAEEWSAKYADTNNERFDLSDYMLGGKVSINYVMNDSNNIYLSYAKGYKQGGFNVGLGLLGQVDPSDLEYEPEHLRNVELGLNAEINNYVGLSLSLFRSLREDQQVLISTQVDPNDPNTFVYLTKNAAEGLNYGAEITADINLSDNISAFVNLGYLETEIKNWVSRPDVAGRAQAHAPKFSLSSGINYNLNLNTSLSVNFVGKSSFYYSDSHDNRSDSYILTNARLTHTINDWTLDIWVQNLFDEYYSTRGFYFGNEAPDFIDTLYRRHGDPRHFGISLKYDF